jgi:hypothetical protein
MTGRSDGSLSRPPVRSPSATRVARRHARFVISLPVRCSRLASRTPHAWRGRTTDISGGGVAIELPTRLPPGTRVAIEVRTGIGPVRMESQVLWTRRLPGEAGLTRHGLCLADRSELLDLPIMVLLGQWLGGLSRSKTGPPSRAAARAKRIGTR